MGAFYKKKHAGTFSDIAAFSTHPLKNLNGLGDGGFIITNKKTLYNKIKLYRNHGLKGRDNVEVIGVNSRLDSLNAEVLNYVYGEYEISYLAKEIIKVRLLVEQELAGGSDKIDIKRGKGGVMDIDFLTHFLQQLYCIELYFHF